MAEPSKQVVGYARVSVDAPDKVSPEMQAEAIEAQCKLKGWELVDLIVERGRSAGEGKKRPGLDRARKLIRTGKATGLVVWKIDRCSRSVRDFAEILAELRDHDADFVSVTESFDTSNAMGRAMLQITMVFAELERARMGERAAAWQAYRAKQGGTPTTRAILGYRRVDGQLLLDEQTAPIVKQAVEILLETGSLSAAAGFLRDCGHPKYLSAARSLLSSPTLAGGRSVDGVFVAGGWPALIDVATHEAVLAIFADPRRVNKGRPASQRWLLTSIAMCGAPGCGLPMGAGQATPAAMYRCARVRRPFMPGPPCGLQIVRDGLDAYVEQRLLARVSPDMWRRMRTRRRTVAAPVVDGVALEAKLSQLAEDWGRDRITRAEWDAARQALLGRIGDIEADADDDEVNLPDVSNLHKAWRSLSIEHKRLVIAAFVERVVVAPGRRGRRPNGVSSVDERVQIHWR